MSLGTGALQVGGVPEQFRHSREVSMATLQAGTAPWSGRQLAPSHWKGASVDNTYLTLYLPTQRSQGWEGWEQDSATIRLKKALEQAGNQQQLIRNDQQSYWSAKISL